MIGAFLLAPPTLLLAHAASAQSVDDSINSIFQNATGWFVGLVFAPLPGTNTPWIIF